MGLLSRFSAVHLQRNKSCCRRVMRRRTLNHRLHRSLSNSNMGHCHRTLSLWGGRTRPPRSATSTVLARASPSAMAGTRARLPTAPTTLAGPGGQQGRQPQQPVMTLADLPPPPQSPTPATTTVTAPISTAPTAAAVVPSVVPEYMLNLETNVTLMLNQQELILKKVEEGRVKIGEVEGNFHQLDASVSNALRRIDDVSKELDAVPDAAQVAAEAMGKRFDATNRAWTVRFNKLQAKFLKENLPVDPSTSGSPSGVRGGNSPGNSTRSKTPTKSPNSKRRKSN